jgi:hypothetical protein
MAKNDAVPAVSALSRLFIAPVYIANRYVEASSAACAKRRRGEIKNSSPRYGKVAVVIRAVHGNTLLVEKTTACCTGGCPEAKTCQSARQEN